MTKKNQETRPPLPDFRNLGILLRVALGVQVLALAAALAAAEGLAGAVRAYLGYSAYVQPPLLACLLILYLASPGLAGLSSRRYLAVAVSLPAACALVWQGFLFFQFPDLGGLSLATSGLPRATLLGGLAGFAMATWLDWRARLRSPALAEARLQALQARIRPHFLFNSLNSVLSLMRSDPGRAESALENLAELYRMLMADNRQLSSLGRELDLAQAYLDLEALRLGERLAVDWRVDSAPRSAQMPALILQPLLENAVCHGIEPLPEGGRIGVDIFVKEGRLTVVVRNPFRLPEAAGAVHGGGVRRGNRMALGNIRERLVLHFDAEARLSAHAVGGEFVVQMALPLRLTDHEPAP